MRILKSHKAEFGTLLDFFKNHFVAKIEGGPLETLEKSRKTVFYHQPWQNIINKIILSGFRSQYAKS